MPAKVQVIFYSTYGHVWKMAEAVAEGARQAGADVQKLLPHLSTYLGHVNVAATQVYLTMTPALLQLASERFAQYAFQEVNHA